MPRIFTACVIAPSIFVIVAGCGEVATETSQAAQTVASASGWSIDHGGDLNQFFECLEESGAALVSAHRGGPAPGFPENAIETMSAVLADTPAIMEIDVATSADGVLYLMHDDTLERTTAGAGAANGKQWADIRKLKLEDNDGNSTPYEPPRFDDALLWADGKTILQIDFKRSTRYEDVIEEISRQGAEDRVILIAYSLASAQKLHRLAPGAMISLSVNSQSELNRAVAAGVPADRLMGFTGTEAPRPRLFSTLNSRDVEVIFGTLGGRSSIDNEIFRDGEPQRYVALADDGVDIIATDRPRAAHQALSNAGRAATDGVCGVAQN